MDCRARASLHATASTSAALSTPRRRLDVRCMARKPTRLSQNKKNAKLKAGAEKARRTKMRRKFDQAADSPGELTPQERVDAAGHEARRWLGQHFLIDHSVILDALEAAAVASDDRILEIGPGTGNLTVELVKAGAQITAVEKDRNLADKLKAQYPPGDDTNVTVHEADFLKWNVGKEFEDVTAKVAALNEHGPDANGNYPGDAHRAKVVANIPYNITTDILKTLLPMGDTFGDMVFMFQEEVARRLIRTDSGASDYRPMSVRVHFYSTPYYVRPVTAACFDPPPNVESCLVGFRPKPRREYPELRGTEKQFFTFVQACFAQKRKMLKNNLRAVCDDDTVTDALAMLGRDEKTRAQQLTMEEYVRLFNFVRERAPTSRGPRVVDGGDGSKDSDAAIEKESKSVREKRARVERATSRLVAQAVGRTVEDPNDDGGVVEV